MTTRDAERLYSVFFRAVRDGATAYTPAQRRAWASAQRPTKGWHRKLAAQSVWVARTSQGPIGFITLRRDGYVDFAYILKSYRGRGVFRALMDPLLAKAASRPLTVHASLHAQPAFASCGFEIVHHEIVRRGGQGLQRAYMRRPASS